MSRYEAARRQQIDSVLNRFSSSQKAPDKGMDPRLMERAEEVDPGNPEAEDEMDPTMGMGGQGQEPDIQDPEKMTMTWEERQAKAARKRLYRDGRKKTLTKRRAEVERAFGIVVPDQDMKGAFVRSVMGQPVIEWDNGTFMRDRGGAIEVAALADGKSPDESVRAAIAAAHKKGWGSIDFKGDQALGDKLWMEAQRYGIKLDDFEPSVRAMDRLPDYLKKHGMAPGVAAPGEKPKGPDLAKVAPKTAPDPLQPAQRRRMAL